MIYELINYSEELLYTYFKGKKPKRMVFEDVFSDISSVLMEVSIDLESGNNPEKSCLRILELTKIILSELSPLKKDKHIIKLYGMLDNCNKINKKYDKNKLSEVISELRKTSIEFKALSLSVRYQ
jgi:hypothetical protein